MKSSNNYSKELIGFAMALGKNKSSWLDSSRQSHSDADIVVIVDKKNTQYRMPYWMYHKLMSIVLWNDDDD